MPAQTEYALLVSTLAEARTAVASAREVLHDAEMRVAHADAHLNRVMGIVKTGERKEASFTEMTDAIQTLQFYAIRNGISLGHTMDNLTERLLSADGPAHQLKKKNHAIQVIENYAISNNISLGSLMDAVTERLSSTAPTK